MSKFVDFGRDQAFLLSPNLRDCIPEDDLARVVIAARNPRPRIIGPGQ